MVTTFEAERDAIVARNKRIQEQMVRSESSEGLKSTCHDSHEYAHGAYGGGIEPD